MFQFGLQELLNKLVESNCLIIKKNMSGLDEYYIPYMMNDAVEYYIKLENGVFTGDLGNIENVIKAEYLVEYDSKNLKKQGIIFTKKTGEFNTIWFENYEIVCELYKYSNLGHFWRPGNDSIRRLVYLIGTIYDKYKYLGENSCNNMELETMKLLGVAPLREFSPIDEDFAVFYEKEELENLEISGVELLTNIAQKAGAKELVQALRDYIQTLKKSNIINRFHKRKNSSYVTKLLADSSNYAVIMEIEKLVCECAKDYQARQSDISIKEKIESVDKYIKDLGYEGEYPEYKASKQGLVYNAVFVYEQQPFVVKELEYEGVEFKVFPVFRNYEKGQEKVMNV